MEVDQSPDKGCPSSENVAQAARVGAGWGAAGRLISQVVQLATSVALARLLVPDDFGLIGMAVAVGGLARAVGDFGISTLVVQRRSLGLDFLRAAYTVNLVVFLGLALLQALLAPLGGVVLDDKRVVGVIAALALALPVQGFASFFQALLKRDLAFSRIVKLNLLEVVVASTVACSLAFSGFGVWSLVLSHIVSTAAVAIQARRMTATDVAVDIPAARRWYREIFGFGKFATGNSVINYFVQNIDYLVVGRMLPTAQLGFYYFAFEKSRILSRRVLGLYSSLALPVFSRLNQNTERIRRAYQMATVAVLLLVAPSVSFLAFHARLVIPLVFGEKWWPSVEVFQILSVAVIVNALTSGVGSVLYAVGRPDVSFRVVRWIPLPLGIGVFVGVRAAGILGAAIAVVLVKGTFSLVKLVVCFRFLGWKWRQTLRPALIVVASATVAGLLSLHLTYRMNVSSDWTSLALAGVLFGLVYGISQITVNRPGLDLVWRGALGPGGLAWCQRILPSPVRSLLNIPSG